MSIQAREWHTLPPAPWPPLAHHVRFLCLGHFRLGGVMPDFKDSATSFEKYRSASHLSHCNMQDHPNEKLVKSNLERKDIQDKPC